MNICEFIQEKIAAGEFDDNVSAHLRICHECKEFADELERFLSCDLPDAGAPSHDVDAAIRAYAAETAEANRLLSCELPEVGEPSAAVDAAIRAYAAETAEANRLLSCELPEVGEPPAAVDAAIRAYAAKASEKAAHRKSGLAKAFRIDARIGGEWKTVYADDLSILRLRKVSFGPVDADALRLVVTEAWGGGKAHVFAFDAR